MRLAVSAEAVEALQNGGKTVILVGTSDRILCVVTMADEARPKAMRTVERLHDLGVERTVMLTEDNEVTARAVGEVISGDEVRAEVLSEEQAETVAELDEEFGGVILVGDGVNDASALATVPVVVGNMEMSFGVATNALRLARRKLDS